MKKKTTWLEPDSWLVTIVACLIGLWVSQIVYDWLK